MAGLIIIAMAVLIGIFAYFLGTDTTPNADRQIVEIQARKPGFTQLFIKIKKEKEIHPTGFFSRLLFGAEDKYIADAPGVLGIVHPVPTAGISFDREQRIDHGDPGNTAAGASGVRVARVGLRRTSRPPSSA